MCAQWLAWRLALPSILLLLVFGFVAGTSVTEFLDTDALLGNLLFPIVSISVALILYEGGLSLKLSELPKVGGVVRNLVTLGAAVSWAGSAAAAHFIFKLDWQLAILLGAILVVTGPTVIGPLLRHIRPSGAVGPVLKWEGIVIDPIGALLAVLVFEIIAGGSHGAISHVVIAVSKTIVYGGGLGLAGAGLLTLMIHRYWIPDFLQNAVSLMLVIAVFALSNGLQEESGLLAVTVMGFALANQKWADIKHIVEFKENLRVLLISGLFILLAARLKMDASRLVELGLSALAFVAVLVLFVRPLGVFLCTLGSKLSSKEKLFLACMAPRGIVAAAISSIFALRLGEESNFQQADSLALITFMTIVGTVAIYGLTAPLLARRLGVAEANPQGLLIVGAHAWARALAGVLQEKKFSVLLVDSNRDNIAAARMAGLRTYDRSILAQDVLDELELGGIGRLLAVTPNDWVNVLAVQRFMGLFGRPGCYQLLPQRQTPKQRERHKHLHGRWLFDESATFGELESRIVRGDTVKATPLTESFDYAAFRDMYGESALPMFVITENGRLEAMTAERPGEPAAGQTLISLVGPETKEVAGAAPRRKIETLDGHPDPQD